MSYASTPSSGYGSAWFSAPRSNPAAKLRLFCFPHSGAAASLYYSWAAELPRGVELLPIQLPGHGDRLSEPLRTQFTQVVPEVADAMRPLLDKPYALFGHSLGAILAFEVARWMRRQSGPLPVHLFVSGHQAPHLPDTEAPVHHLPDGQFRQKLSQMNGMPAEMFANDELMAILLPILRADFEMSETYTCQPESPLPCPFSACGGLADPHVSREHLDAWKEHTCGEFRLRMFPGDHFFVNSARSLLVEALARELRFWLV